MIILRGLQLHLSRLDMNASLLQTNGRQIGKQDSEEAKSKAKTLGCPHMACWFHLLKYILKD